MTNSTRRALVAVLLVVAIVVPLLVGIYDKEDPTFLGFPFYFWFQFLLIPLVSLCTFGSFLLLGGRHGDATGRSAGTAGRDRR